MPETLTLDSFRSDLAELLHQRPDEVDLEENPWTRAWTRCASPHSPSAGGPPVPG